MLAFSAVELLAQANPDGELFVAQNIAFYLTAAVMLYSAFRVVTTSNVVHAALYLVLVLAGVAVNFLLLGSEFAGATQVLVYIGAVIVLFLFGIMLTRAEMGEDESVGAEKRTMGVVVALMLMSVMTYALVDAFEDDLIIRTEPSTTEAVSDAIFKDYIVPFEAMSVLLLAALIGAIVIARKD